MKSNSKNLFKNYKIKEDYKVRVYYTGYIDTYVLASSEKEAKEEAIHLDPFKHGLYKKELLNSLEIQQNNIQILK